MIFENWVTPQAGKAKLMSRSKSLSATISVSGELGALAPLACAKQIIWRSYELTANRLRPKVASADRLSSSATDNARSRLAQVATNSPVYQQGPHFN
jgi:hypothetical protein